MPKKFCCPECFDDRGLRNNIFPSLEPEHGTCSFCGTEKTALVEPIALGTYFELLANVYEINAEGKALVEWMKEDWLLFSHTKMDVAHAKELLSEILDNGEIVRQLFSPSSRYISEGLVQWETLHSLPLSRFKARNRNCRGSATHWRSSLCCRFHDP